MEALEEKLFYLFKFIPVSPGVILPWLITLAIGIVLYLCSRNMTTDCKTKGQATLEYLYETLKSLMMEITGEEYAAQLTPILSTIFIYIFSANLMGLVPGLKSPTSLFSNCLGMALIVFIYTTYLGIKKHGFKYHGSMSVLKVIMNYEYLWQNIRVLGGAYGCMSGFSHDGMGYFVSYRDPNLKETLEIPSFWRPTRYLRALQIIWRALIVMIET